MGTNLSYHGPSEIVKKIGERSYEVLYRGCTFQRDQGMLIPASHMKPLTCAERAAGNGTPSNPGTTFSSPVMHQPGAKPVENELVLLKGGKNDQDWYCAKILKVLTDRIKVSWYTTDTEPLSNYRAQSRKTRTTNLAHAKFKTIWVVTPSGLPTIIDPRASKSRSRLYTGKIPIGELDQHLLIRNVALKPSGRLSPPNARPSRKAVKTTPSRRRRKRRLQVMKAPPLKYTLIQMARHADIIRHKSCTA
jgi:hypothetical protein